MRAKISQFLEINFLICDDYESLLSECPVKRRSATVEKSYCTSFQQQSIYIHRSARDKFCEFRGPKPAQAFSALFATTATRIKFFPILYIDRKRQSLKGHASIEFKVLINLLYTKLLIYIFMKPTNFNRELPLLRHTLFTENNAVIFQRQVT